jgi:sodium/potassium-transporting ATPase subunit alpha
VNYFWYASDQGVPWGVFWAWGWGEGWYGKTASELSEIVNVGQCIFFVTLVLMQFGNALAVRTRRVSLLHHNPLWGPHRNLYLPLGMLAAFVVLIIITLGPFFQNTFLTRQVPIKHALVACAGAAFLVLWDEARKWIVRNKPESWVARVAW